MFDERKVSKVIIAANIVLAMTFIGLLFYIQHTGSSKRDKKPLARKISTAVFSHNKKVDDEQIAKNAVSVIYETKYKSCGHTIKRIDVIPAGKEYSLDSILSAHNGYALKECSGNVIELYKEEDGYCPHHYVLKELGGYLAIYYKQSNADSPIDSKLKEVTKISVNTLALEEQEALKKGIQINSDEELFNKLQELTS